MRQKKIRLKSTPQVKKFNKTLRKASKINHVVRHQDGWAVKKNGASRASKVHETQKEAIKDAVSMAKNNGTSVIVHRRDGRIRNVRSYNNHKD